MDCDLQDPVEVLIQLYETCQRDNLDICFRVVANGTLHFVALAYCFLANYLKAAEHEWPRNAGDFCVFSARCQQTLLALPEQWRMLRGLRSWVGFRREGII